jgi:hypothetical protein
VAARLIRAIENVFGRGRRFKSAFKNQYRHPAAHNAGPNESVSEKMRCIRSNTAKARAFGFKMNETDTGALCMEKTRTQKPVSFPHKPLV